MECLLTAGLLSKQQLDQPFLALLKDIQTPEEVTCQALAFLLAWREKLFDPTKQMRRTLQEVMYDGRRTQDLGR